MKVGSRAPEPDAQSRWKTIAWLIGPLAVVAGVAYLVFQPSFDPVALTSSPTPSAAMISTVTPFPTPDWEPVDVESIEQHAVPFDLGQIRDFSLAGERIVAVGEAESRAAAWYSDDDGESWSAASVESLEPPSNGVVPLLETVAAFDNKIVAFGEWANPTGPGERTWGAWISEDAGQHWREEPRDDLPDRVVSLTSGEDGFVAVGGRSLGQAWRSTDGVLWDKLEYDSSMRTGQLFGVTRIHERLVVTGVDAADADLAFSPVIWTYSDSQGWTVASHGQFGNAVIGEVVDGPSGVWAAGMVLPDSTNLNKTNAAIWFSADGATWDETVLNELPSSQAGALATNGLGTLISGFLVGTAASADPGPDQPAWFIPSGANAKSGVQTYPLDHLLTAAIGTGDRFIAFGICPDDAPTCDGDAIILFNGSDKPYPSLAAGSE